MSQDNTKYDLNRNDFVNYYPVELYSLIDISQVTKDLIMGGEFIITAQDLLDSMTYIDAKLVGGKGGQVLASECKLIYNH